MQRDDLFNERFMLRVIWVKFSKQADASDRANVYHRMFKSYKEKENEEDEITAGPCLHGV